MENIEKVQFHLNLKKKWFDMILSGEKKEEYREIKPYFIKRFKRSGHIHINKTWWPFSMVEIIFSNGYRADRRQMKAEITGMRFHEKGLKNWGADPCEFYFILELGKVELI